MKVTSNGEEAAYVWLTYVASTGEPIHEFHVCAAPHFQGLWLTPAVLKYMLGFLLASGARYILALHGGPYHKDLLVRLGWRSKGPHVQVLDLQEIPQDGIYSRLLRARGC